MRPMGWECAHYQIPPLTLLLLSSIGPASPYKRSPNTNGSIRSPLLVFSNLQSGQVRKVSDPLQQNHRLGFFFLRSQSISVKPSFSTHRRRHGSLFSTFSLSLQFPFVDFIDNFVSTDFVNFCCCCCCFSLKEIT